VTELNLRKWVWYWTMNFQFESTSRSWTRLHFLWKSANKIFECVNSGQSLLGVFAGGHKNTDSLEPIQHFCHWVDGLMELVILIITSISTFFLSFCRIVIYKSDWVRPNLARNKWESKFECYKRNRVIRGSVGTKFHCI